MLDDDSNALFRRWCPHCQHRGIRARGLAPAQKLELARSFAARHWECFKRRNPGANVERCRACGLLLLNGNRCPEHVRELRVEWTPEMDRAYRAIVDAFAAGVGITPFAPLDAFDQAYGFAKAWGMYREPWLREVVA